MRCLLVGLALVLMGCGQPRVAVPPRDDTLPSLLPTPAVASEPRVATEPRVASTPRIEAPRLALSCRLPVTFVTASRMRGAWLDLATGTVTYDPAGEFEIDQNAYLVRSKAEPRLVGVSFPQSSFYSQTAHRWLPVRREAVSPDGTHYAYADSFRPPSTVRLHVVDIATGQEAVYPLPGSGPNSFSPYAVVDFGIGGIAVTIAWEGTRGVWRIDPTSGRVTSISSADNIWYVNKDTIWTGSVNPADPNPAPGMGGNQPDQVDRITIGGARETWLYRESTSLGVVGVDAHGSPIVFMHNNRAGIDEDLLFLVTAPNVARPIGAPGLFAHPAAIDKHGVWFAGADGIYLLPDGGMLAKVSDVVATPAGGCV